MPILPQGDLFAPGPSVSGSKPHGKTFRYCPYSTQITDYNGDTTIPAGDKVFHGETGGKLYVYSLGRGAGWVCPDNDCPYYTGTFATTTSGFEVNQEGREFNYLTGCPKTEADFATISGSVLHLNKGRKIVPGTRFFLI